MALSFSLPLSLSLSLSLSINLTHIYPLPHTLIHTNTSFIATVDQIPHKWRRMHRNELSYSNIILFPSDIIRCLFTQSTEESKCLEDKWGLFKKKHLSIKKMFYNRHELLSSHCPHFHITNDLQASAFKTIQGQFQPERLAYSSQ